MHPPECLQEHFLISFIYYSIHLLSVLIHPIVHLIQNLIVRSVFVTNLLYQLRLLKNIDECAF